MKWLLIFLLISCKANGQTFHFYGNTKKLVWDSTKYYTVCGLNSDCLIPDEHYKLLKDEADGVPIYGPEQALIGVKTKSGFFVPIRRRDHLAGHHIDAALLQDTAKMNNYLKTVL